MRRAVFAAVVCAVLAIADPLGTASMPPAGPPDFAVMRDETGLATPLTARYITITNMGATP